MGMTAIGSGLALPCLACNTLFAGLVRLSVLVIVYRRKQQKLTAEMNKMMEDLEMDIRNDIRQGQPQILKMYLDTI